MSIAENGNRSGKVAGSFRDPSGYVFEREGRVFRAVDEACHGLLRGLADQGLLRRLTERRSLVGTRFVDEPELSGVLSAEHPGYAHFLEHDRVAPITYPAEWCVSMLADAALHTLDLQEQLLAAGYSLKDATAYNLQFVDGKPVFIDLSSIERPARLDVWFALGQFAQMFTYPLLLFAHHGWDIRSYFLGSLNGRDVEQVAGSFGRLERWLPRALLDVTLPLFFHRKSNKEDAAGGNGRAVLEKSNPNPRTQLVNLQRLRAKVGKLAAGYRPHGTWADYTSACSYEDEAQKAKKALVKEFIETVRPRRLLDAGCNTGDYSYLAAGCGTRVLAADADHGAVEILYRRLRANPAPITPVVVDLCNPTPPTGYLNRERPSFLERLDVDCVLALALLHHLHVSGNLPLTAIRDLFFELTKDSLILEFVPTDDVMFKKLMRFRVDLYGRTTLEACRAVFTERFDLVREEPIPHSPRTLLLFRKRPD